MFHVSAVAQSSAVKQDSGVISVSVGDNVTLHCFYQSDVAMHFSWYWQTFGSTPQLLSTVYKYDRKDTFHPLKKKPRFAVERDEGINHLHISDVQCSDAATYFCGSSHSNVVEFGEGVFLNVKGSGTNLIEIVQQPVSESVQPGASVTLNCTVQTGTCDGEHSVYWFRHGSRPGVLHIHGDRCKEISKPGSPSQSCVYRLQKTNLSSSDAGTYYCAVASCGEILFGSGSKLHIKNGVEGLTAQMRILD
ncbi:immunoglobulin kappa light chain-like [Centroberyx gerrardi]|uniref:immunoglobulin kappa light chain-like n=1 Tax=Centroberyx gerrardi TaxID=166262 RepID=UPI003AAF34EF